MTPPPHSTGLMSPRRVALTDDALTNAAAELLKHDARVGDVDMEVRMDGGVAHLTGAVPATADLDQVRELIGRLAGVHAVWDRVLVDGRPPRTVDLGCGDTTQYE